MTVRQLWWAAVSLAPSTPTSAVTDLGLGGSMTPEQEAERRKKLMAAAGGNPLQRYGEAAMSLLGSQAPSYGARL